MSCCGVAVSARRLVNCAYWRNHPIRLEAGQLEAQRQDPGILGILGTIEVGMLRETFPKWCIFGASGAWWATRGDLQVWSGPRSLLLRVISATDLTALAERLCLQEWLDGSTMRRSQRCTGAPCFDSRWY
jgi:hypothetical protein